MQTVYLDLPNIKKGDTLYTNFVYYRNGEAVNLSGYTSAIAQFRQTELSDSVLNLSSSGGTIDISNLAAGQIILNSPTTGVNAGQYYFDVQLKDDVNNITSTVRSGRITFIEDYAR